MKDSVCSRQKVAKSQQEPDAWLMLMLRIATHLAGNLQQ